MDISMLSETSMIVASKTIISANLASETVLLNPDLGMYYSLNEVGSRVWDLIQSPKTLPQIYESVTAEYDVEPDRCEQDILALLQNLADKELIKIDVESGS